MTIIWDLQMANHVSLKSLCLKDNSKGNRSESATKSAICGNSILLQGSCQQSLEKMDSNSRLDDCRSSPLSA